MFRLYSYLAAVASGITILLAVFMAGRRGAKKEVELNNLKDYVATQERVNDAEISTTTAHAIERLRKRGNFRD